MMGLFYLLGLLFFFSLVSTEIIAHMLFILVQDVLWGASWSTEVMHVAIIL